jgi:hypothetical protein
MTDLRPLKPRRFGDGGLMVTVTGFQSVTAGSPACCEAVSEQASSCASQVAGDAFGRGHPRFLQQRRVIARKYAADIETLNQGEPGS